ncbi:hypothetical protein [Streptomyces sp. NPDC094466]|uniref:hypothetical protein n=1 Tax=Streptomyces sp. NPDC094466 TaxID=3366065 RepID=UPI0037F2A6DD
MSRSGTDAEHLDGVPRALLETWPGRFRFPELLVALVSGFPEGATAAAPGGTDAGPEEDPADDTGTLLARAVLGSVGGRPPRAVCKELIERGEFTAAEYALTECAELDEHDRELLHRRLRAARAGARESVRQRVATLRRRAEAAGIGFAPPDLALLGEAVENRTADAEAVLRPAGARLDEAVGGLVALLEEDMRRQSGDRPASGFAAERLAALIASGELVAVRALLEREPLGTAIPESVVPLPRWRAEWEPDTVLEFHLNETLPRPPEFAFWEAADGSGRELLLAYDRLQREDDSGAAEAFADCLGRFLGAPGGTGRAASRIGDSAFHFTFLDGLFAAEPFTRLHPTGRVDLYVGGPGVTALPEQLAAQAAHIAVAPGLSPSAYTDRRATAVLSLRDLLRLVVLREDRAAALLGVLAPQWPVTALTGTGADALADVLGGRSDDAWRTLRWIAHLSLGAGHEVVEAMENCTGLDPLLLRRMLLEAERHPVGARLWRVEDGGWQGDEALVHALREELVSRCGDPAAVAAWWAALPACEPDTGRLSREDLVPWVEEYSDWALAPELVTGAVGTLVARGLLRARVAEGPDADGGPDQLFEVRLNGVVRLLAATAEKNLPAALERLRRAYAEQEDASADPAGADPGLPEWHRNRFAAVAAGARHAEAAAQGADGDTLAALAAEAERELGAEDPSDVGVEPGSTELAALLETLAGQCGSRYPGTVLDVRCPPALRAEVPEPVLRAALYEVLDNAARAVAGRDGRLVQVLARSESPEVLVEIQDSGPGLPPDTPGRRIFALSGAARRETGRGGGLHRARQYLRACSTPAVEADLEVFTSRHPTLTGAALRLILPEAAP